MGIQEDEKILEKLRQLVRRYVDNQWKGYSAQIKELEEQQKKQIKRDYWELQKQLRDPILKSYTHFELLEKMMRCEQAVGEIKAVCG